MATIKLQFLCPFVFVSTDLNFALAIRKKNMYKYAYAYFPPNTLRQTHILMDRHTDNKFAFEFNYYICVFSFI